ncbi:MAG: alanine racemase [Chloroflexota bacterium]
MISLYDILEASNGQLFGEAAAQLFTGFSLDPAHAQESHLFVAIKSDFGDTHQNMSEAIQNGATGVLCSSPPEFDTENVSVIVVRDTEKAIMDWTRYALRQSTARKIAVTGTAGRTTTIAAIAAVLGTEYRVHTHTDEYHIGRLSLPLALAKMEQHVDFILVDMMADRVGELAQLMDIVQPEAVVVANIGQAYLDRFESMEHIAVEHAVTVENLPENGFAVLNYDDDRVRTLYGRTHARTMTVGIDSFGADLMAYNIVVGPSRTGFDLRAGNKRYVGNWVPQAGEMQLYCALFALSIGMHYNIPVDDALRSLTNLDPLPGRMNVFIGQNGCLIIDDTYDATPESTIAALDWLEKISDESTRLIFMFGDIDHLGEANRQAHRYIGQRAAEIADIIITEGAHAAVAGRAAQDVAAAGSGLQVYMAYSLKDAVETLTLIGDLNEQDTVLVCGGAGAQMELIVRALLPDESDHGKLTRQRELDTITIQPGRPLQPSWVEVNMELLATNVRTIKGYLGEEVAMMATVKADAYGHGAVAVSQVALQNGADYLAVASVREALELRDAGINAPILVLSYTPVYAVREALRHGITITVYDLDLARAYNKVAREMNRKLKIHVKVDSGMGRLGILPGEAVDLFRHLLTMQNLDLEGIYTHFSNADENEEYTAEQYKAFRGVLIPLRAGGIKFQYVHVANSAGMLVDRKYHHNMVRTGIAMYGYPETAIGEQIEGLQPLLTWKTVIAQVKTLPPGHYIGYGNEYITRDYERVAVIPVGYADGLRRAPVNWGNVLVHGQVATIRGRVSMEKTVISVNHIEGVSVGDEVVLLGRQGEASITAQDVADRLETISYEVLTGVLARIPRR